MEKQLEISNQENAYENNLECVNEHMEDIGMLLNANRNNEQSTDNWYQDGSSSDSISSLLDSCIDVQG